MDAGYRLNDFIQALPSLHDGLAGNIPAVIPKQIKDKIDDRNDRAFLPLL